MDEHVSGSDGRGTDGEAMRHYLGVVRRRIWVMLTVFVLALTLGTVWVFRLTPVYQGTARILIERHAPRPTNFQEVVQVSGREREYYRTQEQLIKSRAVLEKAAALPCVAGLPELAGQGAALPTLTSRMAKTIRAVMGTRPPKPLEPWERLRSLIHVQQVKDTHIHGLGYYDSKYMYYGYHSYYHDGYYASGSGGDGDAVADLEETVARLERHAADLEDVESDLGHPPPLSRACRRHFALPLSIATVACPHRKEPCSSTAAPSNAATT